MLLGTTVAPPRKFIAGHKKAEFSQARRGQVEIRQQVLRQKLGAPNLLPTGRGDGSTATVYSRPSGLQQQDKDTCMRSAHQLLAENPEHLEELSLKQHTQLQLDKLQHTAAGRQLLATIEQQALQPFRSAGMHIAAFEVVYSRNNTKHKPLYKGYYIHNKLGCQHQDLRQHEPWFDRASSHGLPGCLRLVFDIFPAGQRWFEFRLLRKDARGVLWLDEQPLLELRDDLVAFDPLAAGSGGFFNPGGTWIFHARRSSNPQELGVSVVVDVVVSAGLDGADAACYSHTATFQYFHG